MGIWQLKFPGNFGRIHRFLVFLRAVHLATSSYGYSPQQLWRHRRAWKLMITLFMFLALPQPGSSKPLTWKQSTSSEFPK